MTQTACPIILGVTCSVSSVWLCLSVSFTLLFSVCLSVCLALSVSVSLCLSQSLSACLPSCLPACLSVCLFVCLSLLPWFWSLLLSQRGTGLLTEFNPFTAMVAAPSPKKQPITVPNLKSSRLFPSFAWARKKTSIKRHITEIRFVTGPSNILFAGAYVCSFQPGNVTGWGSEGVNHYVQVALLLLRRWYTSPFSSMVEKDSSSLMQHTQSTAFRHLPPNCQNWSSHWNGTFYLRAPFHRRGLRSPKGLSTDKTVETSQGPCMHVNMRRIRPGK